MKQDDIIFVGMCSMHINLIRRGKEFIHRIKIHVSILIVKTYGDRMNLVENYRI